MPVSNSNPQRWLNLIRYAEGTLGPDAYNTAFSGARFDSNQPHPGTVYTSKSGYKSAAHGAYQFMPDTWAEINSGQNVPMTAANQDKGALALMRRAGVDPNSPFSADVLAKLAGTWASLPTLSGKSAYNQPVKSLQELQKAFNDYVAPIPPKVNTPNQQGHFNPNSVGKMGPTYRPNSSADGLVISKRKNKTSKLDSRGVDEHVSGGKRGKNRNDKGLSKFDKKALSAVYGSKMDLGKTLKINTGATAAAGDKYGPRAMNLNTSRINQIAWGGGSIL